MKKLAIVALIVGLFYLPTLLIIQSGNKTIGSYTTEDVWENNAYIKTELSYADVFGHSIEENNKVINGNINTADEWYLKNGMVWNSNGWFENLNIVDTNTYVKTNNISLLGTSILYLSIDYKSSYFSTHTALFDIRGSEFEYRQTHTLIQSGQWENYSEIINLGFNATSILIGSANYIATGDLSIDNIIIFDLTEMYGIGQEPSIEEFERDLQIFKDRVGEASYGGYEHKTDNGTDIDGWDLGEAKVKDLFTFIAQPFTVINKARVQGAEYVGNWTYDKVVKQLVNLGNTLSENIENYIDGLWLDIYGLGEDIKDALYKIWDGATFWN